MKWNKEILQKWSSEKKFRISLFVLCFFLAAIWGQSMMPRGTSQKESDTVVAFLQPLHGVEKGEEPSDEYWHFSDMIRKLAHVIEYAILGIQLCVTGRAYKRMRGETGVLEKTFLAALAVSGMIVGLTDETIQVFSHRGSQVIDVWIDLAGVCMGIGIMKIVEKGTVIKGQQ